MFEHAKSGVGQEAARVRVEARIINGERAFVKTYGG